MGQNMGQHPILETPHQEIQTFHLPSKRKRPEINRFLDKFWQQYNKLIQCYSLIQCNACQYNVAFPYTLYRSHNQIVFLHVKYTAFRTILGRFSTEWKS